MKIPDRLGLIVGMLVAVLAALTAMAVYSLVLLGSPLLAALVAAGGVGAMAAVGAAHAAARQVEAVVPDLSAPLPAPPEPATPPVPPPRQGFRLRQARPGEVPAPYLAAVRKGAQATHAALKARDRQAGAKSS